MGSSFVFDACWGLSCVQGSFGIVYCGGSDLTREGGKLFGKEGRLVARACLLRCFG